MRQELSESLLSINIYVGSYGVVVMGAYLWQSLIRWCWELKRLKEKWMLLHCRVCKYEDVSAIAKFTGCDPEYIRKGIAIGLFHYARCLQLGRGLTQNTEKALHYYTKVRSWIYTYRPQLIHAFIQSCGGSTVPKIMQIQVYMLQLMFSLNFKMEKMSHLSDFDHGMVVSARSGLSIPETVDLLDGAKNKNIQWTTVLQAETSYWRERSDWFELTESLQ